MSEEEFKKEKEHLKQTVKLAKQTLKQEEHFFKNLEKLTEDEYLLESLSKTHFTKLRNLEKATSNPYFARIDFKEKEREVIYIGKTNIFDEEHNVAVADWRAPISSVYYDGEIGKTEYKCPDGIISGELLLKRQYQIENEELLNYNDINITTNDELLQECLKQNSDVRLKNIVSTIQKEQNKIIRANMFKPLIVQGVAGSGKTTVAIHRIAYLIYTYEKNFKPEDFLIIAPNKFFLDYIKDSLPDLGVDYVRQETFEQFAEKIIKDKLKIENPNKNLIKIVEENNEETKTLIKTTKFKGSLEFKDAIDTYIKELNSHILEERDFEICGIKIFSVEKLQKIVLDNYKRYPLKVRIEKLEKCMKKQMEKISEIVIEKIKIKRTKELSYIKSEEQEKRIEIFEKYEKEISSLIKNNGAQIVKQYTKNIKIPSAINCYKNILNDFELLHKYIDEDVIEYIQKKSNQKNKTIEYEDLTPILHIEYNLFGMSEKLELKHIVIDEAQDYSEFQFYTLNEVLSNNKSLTILGDIAQGIYEYRGTNNWKEINEKIFKNEANIEYLKQSYRTTSEVMEEANKIIRDIKDRLNIFLANPISRHGEKIQYYKMNEKEKINKIKELVKSSKEKGLSNIAIICKNNKTCEKIYENIKDEFENIEIINEKSDRYIGGITIVPSYYSKGLEFDSVIIADYDAYNEDILDKKLLYVAMTRAMHILNIFN